MVTLDRDILMKSGYSSGRGIAVLFSGGADSTLLLFEVAKAAKSIGQKVTALSISTNNINRNQQRLEKTARAKILDSLKQKGYDNIEILEGKMNFDADGPVRYCGRAQDYMWMFAANFYLKKSDIFVGYIGDDNHEIESQFKTISLFNAASAHGESGNILRMPYQTKSKYDIIRKLIDYDLYKLTWFCEFPTGIDAPCGACTTCKNHEITLKSLGLIESISIQEYFAHNQYIHNTKAITVKE